MTKIIQKATDYCIELLVTGSCASLPFHNAGHTLEVYENVMELGTYKNYNLEKLEPLLLAALFHDTGNAHILEGHEHFSIVEAKTFLEEQEYAIHKTTLVVDCIMATQMPQRPKNENEAILCDADLFHLGTKSFTSKNRLLRREWDIFLSKDYSEEQWLTINIEFLRQHTFHTTYGKHLLEPGKQENIKKLQTRLNQLKLV